jgi:hypothetical protein
MWIELHLELWQMPHGDFFDVFCSRHRRGMTVQSNKGCPRIMQYAICMQVALRDAATGW